MVPLLKYTVMRLALFIATLWLLHFLGASPVLSLIGAALVSFLLSYLVLRGPRTALAEQVAERIERRHHRPPTAADEDAALEDAAIEDAATRKAGSDPAAVDAARQDPGKASGSAD